MELTKKQKEIILNIENSIDDVFYIKGSAGTGKTLTLSKLIEEGKFNNILVIAPTATALSVIRRKIPANIKGKFITFKTLASLIKYNTDYIFTEKGLKFKVNQSGVNQLKSFLTILKIDSSDLIKVIEKVGKYEEDRYLVNVDLLNKKLKGELPVKFELETRFNLYNAEDVNLENTKTKSPYDLIIVDEASMINKEEFDVLTKAIELANSSYEELELNSRTKLVLTGDHKQLPPVEGKQPLEFINNTENVLTEILRSNDKIIDYANKIIKGGINTLAHITHFAYDLEEYIDENIDEISKLDVCLAFTNKDVNLLNKKLRVRHTQIPILTENEPIVVTQNSGYIKGRGILFSNSQRMEVIKLYSQKETYDKMSYLFEKLSINDFSNDERRLHLTRLIEQNLLRIAIFEIEGTSEQIEALTSLTLINSYLKSYDEQILKAIADSVMEIEPTYTFVKYKSAYAMTVHKSQGSEWDKVGYFYNRNRRRNSQNQSLDYTAITRAKTDCYLVSFGS